MRRCLTHTINSLRSIRAVRRASQAAWVPPRHVQTSGCHWEDSVITGISTQVHKNDRRVWAQTPTSQNDLNVEQRRNAKAGAGPGMGASKWAHKGFCAHARAGGGGGDILMFFSRRQSWLPKLTEGKRKCHRNDSQQGSNKWKGQSGSLQFSKELFFESLVWRHMTGDMGARAQGRTGLWGGQWLPTKRESERTFFHLPGSCLHRNRKPSCFSLYFLMDDLEWMGEGERKKILKLNRKASARK